MFIFRTSIYINVGFFVGLFSSHYAEIVSTTSENEEVILNGVAKKFLGECAAKDEITTETKVYLVNVGR